MTSKEERQRQNPGRRSQPGELSAWFTRDLKADAPVEQEPLDPTTAGANETASEVIPGGSTPADSALDTTGPPPSREPPGDSDQERVTEAAPRVAGNSLAPQVLPGPEDELAADESSIPGLTPWPPRPVTSGLVLALGAVAVLSVTVLMGRSCTSSAPDTSLAATAPVHAPPQTLAADQPPAPTAARPSGSAQVAGAERAPIPALLPSRPSDFEAIAPGADRRTPRDSPAVARFPDLPPDVLLQAWREAQQNDGETK